MTASSTLQEILEKQTESTHDISEPGMPRDLCEIDMSKIIHTINSKPEKHEPESIKDQLISESMAHNWDKIMKDFISEYEISAIEADVFVRPWKFIEFKDSKVYVTVATSPHLQNAVRNVWEKYKNYFETYLTKILEQECKAEFVA